MPRNRLAKIAACGVMLLLAGSFGGCRSRRAVTKVFLHGETVDDQMRPIANVVVRLRGRETISDQTGRYRFLYLAHCLRPGAGARTTIDDEVRAYAKGFELFRMEYGLPAKELLGTSSCPKETDKYLRLELIRSDLPPSLDRQ